jgi:4a-hydroxytetrahydrobiopterin dehydratase
MVNVIKRLPTLSDQEVQQRLSTLKDWEIDEDYIKRIFKTPSFPASMILANTVAQLAETAQHHPDIKISYRKVSVKLITHSSGGLTEKDFALAQQLNAVLDWQPEPPLGTIGADEG